MIIQSPLILILCLLLAFFITWLYFREALSRKNELIKDLQKKLDLQPISEDDVRKKIETVDDETRKKIEALNAEHQSKIEALNKEHQSWIKIHEARKKQEVETYVRALDKLERKYDALKKQLDDSGDKS